MRTYVIPTLLLVFAMVTGACAGRQVRSRSFAAPPLAEAPTPAAAEAVPVPTIDVEPAPIVEAPAPSIDGDKPASGVAVELGSTDFDVQGSLDRDIAKSNAEIALEVRRMTEPATRTPYATRREGQLAAALRIDRKRAADLRRSDPGLPAFEDGREAVVGSLASAAPAIEQTPAAPAAPSILPAPPGAKAVLNVDPAKDRGTSEAAAAIDASGREAVAHSHDVRSGQLLVVVLAICVGLLSGLLAAWTQRRRLRAIAATPYDLYPDGTILEQKIVRGVPIIVRVTEPERSEPRSEPAAEQKAKMDSIEQTWHAEGEAMSTQVETAPAPKREIHDLFDNSDAGKPLDFERTDPQPTPVPFLEPDTIVAQEPSVPHAQLDSAPDTRHVPGPARVDAGSDEPATTDVAVAPVPSPAPRSEPEPAKIISSENQLVVSGVADPPSEPRSEPEFPDAKVIYLFEDKSSTEQGVPTAAPAITH